MKLLRVALPLFLAAVTPLVASAQQIPGTELTQVLASRPSLESLLTRFEEASQSNIYSTAVRAQARRQAELVRARLADGDFRVGDRVLLDVFGESTLIDTFTVQAGREINLPNIGLIPLQGVLRFELADYLTQRLSRFLRDPRVRARALIRVTIQGAVGTPGFFTVPVDIPIDEVLRLGGGVNGTSDLEKITIERGNEILYDGNAVQQLITQGATIDALGIQAGDRFRVGDLPARQAQNVSQRAQGWAYILALPFSLLALGRLFGL